MRLNQLRHINDWGKKSFGRSVKGYLGVIWGDFSFFAGAAAVAASLVLHYVLMLLSSTFLLK